MYGFEYTKLFQNYKKHYGNMFGHMFRDSIGNLRPLKCGKGWGQQTKNMLLACPKPMVLTMGLQTNGQTIWWNLDKIFEILNMFG